MAECENEAKICALCLSLAQIGAGPCDSCSQTKIKELEGENKQFADSNARLLKENMRLQRRVGELADGVPLEIQKLETENRQLRELLFAHHFGHYKYLYGDDGELQCAKCVVDFRRDSIEEIREGLIRGAAHD